MPKYIVEGSDLTSVANTIRTKGGTSGSLSFPNGWSSAINAISGGGLEYEEGTWTPAEDVAEAWILFSDTHTTAPLFYEIVDTGNYDATLNTNYSITFASYFGESIKVTASSFYYGIANYRYRLSSATAMSGNTSLITSDIGLTDLATSTGIRASTGGTSRYWRAGRTYKWIAVWAPTT